MKTVSLSGSLRENVGSKDAKILRQEARVPGVVYGNGGNIHFHVKETELNKMVFTPEVTFVSIELDGKEYKAIFKEIQFHPVTDRITHFDLLAVTEDKLIDIALPVKLTGNSPGVLNGGKLRQNYRKLKVKTLAKDLPEFITEAKEANISKKAPKESQFWQTLFISGGRKDKISKGDIAGLFIKQGNISNDQLGTIELKQDCAFVAVPKTEANNLVSTLNNSRLKKKKVRITIL